MRKTVFKFAPYFTPVLLAFTMTGQISALIVLTIILLLFCFMERKEAGIVFALIMPFVLGTAFSVLRLGIPGSIFALFIAVPLLFNELIHIKKRPSAVIFLGFILLTTLFSLLYGGNSNSGNKKFIDMLITITIAIITFYPIAFSKNINFQKVAIVYLISGIFFIDICFDFYGYIRTFNLFDFESFRISAIYNKDLGLPYISYHGPGMIGCYSVAFYLSGKKDGIKVKDVIFFSTVLWLILISGTRQAMLCYFAIVAFWIMIKKEKLVVKNIIITIILFIIAFQFLSALEVESIQNIFDTSSTAEERLNRNYNTLFKTIQENVFWGIGLGNYYNPITGETYAHNLILEILCEMGLVGLTIIMLVTFTFLGKNKFNILKKTENGNLAFIIFIPYFIRAMVSDDFSHNIILFVVLFTLFQKNKVLIEMSR